MTFLQMCAKYGMHIPFRRPDWSATSFFVWSGKKETGFYLGSGRNKHGCITNKLPYFEANKPDWELYPDQAKVEIRVALRLA